MLTTENDREFLQSRLSLFAKVLLLIDLAFTLCLVPVVIFSPLLRGQQFIENVTATLSVAFILAGTWWVTARFKLSARMLLSVEVSLFLSISALLALSAHIAWDVEPQRYGVIVGAVMTSMGRAFFVPSTWQRSAALSALLSAGPVVGILSRAVSPMPGVVASTQGPLVVAVLWGSSSILMAAAGSRVIFGLRREIRRAKELGQYTLDKKLGEGGMGEVYLAHHRMLRRPTAIKLLPPEKAGALAISRFEQEVQLTATLNHPNTVSIYDYGRSADGVFYYAMEHIDGMDLAALVRMYGPQPADRVIHILWQVSLSLGEAHRMGMVHRDVKPANILLAERGGEPDFVKVVDFGLVKDIKQSSQLTDANAVAGTPAYLAPEVMTDPDEVDARVDLYALGAVGYYLLTGQDVFPGKTVVQVLSRHIHDAPEPPSLRLGRPVPPELEALLLRCLSKRPQDRPYSSGALRKELEALPRCGDWSPDQATLFWEGHRERDSVSTEAGAPTERRALTVNIGASA